MSKMYDALIVGGGPAGLSIALGLARVHRTCFVFSDSKYRNDGVTAAHSIITRDHVHPQEIRDLAKKDIKKYGNTSFVDTSITNLSKKSDGFVAKNAAGEEWKGKTVALATGVKDLFPDLPGYAENWPDNIHQCLFCDGHEQSHLPMGMLCYPTFSAGFATHNLYLLKGLSRPVGSERSVSPVYLFTNGTADADDPDTACALKRYQADDIKVDHRPVVKLVRKEEGLDVVLKNEDGSEDSITLGFVAHKPPTALAAPHLADQLGIDTEQGMFGNIIKAIPPFYSTNVPGVFTAGDTGVALTHISNAMLTGNSVASGIAGYVGKIESEEALKRWKAR